VEREELVIFETPDVIKLIQRGRELSGRSGGAFCALKRHIPGTSYLIPLPLSGILGRMWVQVNLSAILWMDMGTIPYLSPEISLDLIS
jgi:hypothetical protein